MNIRQSLNMKMSQNLVMTQSLQQAIKLLQLSKIELESAIREELEQNPVLEEVTEDSAPSAEEKKQRQEERSTSEVDAEGNNLDEFDNEYMFDDYVEYQNTRGMYEHQELPEYDQFIGGTTNLADHLTWQLNLAMFSDKEQEIGEAIIGNLDKNGYLQASVAEIAEVTDADEEDVEFVRGEIMKFDPVGVAALDLKETLTAQLKQIEDRDVDLPITIVNEHLDYLEKHEYKALARELGIKLDELQRCMEIIRSLDPRPGSKYADVSDNFIEPDVFILRDGEEYTIVLNEENLPQLQLNQEYLDMVSRGADYKEETKEYLREHVGSAKWLIKSFMQRQRTIYKVVSSIVERQRAFLDKGIEHLKPMVLADVALDIEMHESTVSRVVTNKFAHTPRGVFELKHFFSTGIRSSNGEEISSLAVKKRIEQIIEGEDQQKPLSDSKIMALLKQDGLKIARRTVAKYREELNIPTSKLRKSIL